MHMHIRLCFPRAVFLYTCAVARTGDCMPLSSDLCIALCHVKCAANLNAHGCNRQLGSYREHLMHSSHPYGTDLSVCV